MEASKKHTSQYKFGQPWAPIGFLFGKGLLKVIYLEEFETLQNVTESLQLCCLLKGVYPKAGGLH